MELVPPCPAPGRFGAAGAFSLERPLYAGQPKRSSRRNLIVGKRTALEQLGDVGAANERLPQPLDLHDRQPAHDRLSRGAGDAELALERLRIEQLRKALTHGAVLPCTTRTGYIA